MTHNMPDELWDILKNSNLNNDEDSKKLRDYFSAPAVIDPTKKTIVFSTPSRTGTSFFRLELPMYAMKRNFPDEFNIIYADGNLNPNHIKLADLIIFHRAGHIHDYFHKVFKLWPKTERRPVIVHDVDDNEFNLPNSHPMKTMWLAAKKDQMSIKSITESDFVTTTGKKLRQTFSNYNKNTNVKIFRNMFDWKMPQWSLKRDAKYDGKIVIGWVGLTSHFEDLRKMAPILKYIHDKFPNTHFILAGMALKDTSVEIRRKPDGTEEMIEQEVKDETQTYKYRVKQLYKDFDQSRIEFLDAVGLEEYGKFYKDLDIGLAFVEKNTFNACKSEIKAVEYMKYGVIPIYSRWGGYADMYENVMDENLKRETSELAIETENPGTWQQVLENVLLNYDKYKSKANGLQKWVEHIYDINRHIEERVEFYRDVIEKHEERQIQQIARYSKITN